MTDFAAAAQSLRLESFTPIPVAALVGDNVVDRSEHMAWYTGPSLLEFLEEVQPRSTSKVPARLPVQMVVRPRSAEHPDYRGYAGRIEAGTLAVGDPVVVLPSGRTSKVEGIDTADGSLESADAGRSVVVRLGDDIDIARGDLIAVDRRTEAALGQSVHRNAVLAFGSTAASG